MRRHLVAVAAIALSLSGVVEVAVAQTAAPPTDSRELGPQTESWMSLQTGGSAASPAERPVPGEIADRIYSRYAESFTHPIPEQFNREKIVSDGGK